MTYLGKSFTTVNNQNGLDLGAGFAELFGIIIIPVGCWFLVSLILTRLPHPAFYWSGAVLLLPAALSMACAGVVMSPINAEEMTSFTPLLFLWFGGLMFVLAAVTGVIGWRMRAGRVQPET